MESLSLADNVFTQTVQNAVSMLCGTEQLIGSLPEVKWAQQARSLATELQEESLRLIVQQLPRVIRTQAFQDLCRVKCSCSPAVPMTIMHVQLSVYPVTVLQREEFTREPALMKKLCSAIREGVTVDNCCDLFTAVHGLCGDDLEEDVQLEQQRQEEVSKSTFFGPSLFIS